MADRTSIPKASRYKDTPIFEGTRGPEFGLWTPPEEALQADRQYKVHRVRRNEVGFMDKVSVRYFGQGDEILWWFVSIANAIIDPEVEMTVGQQLEAPPRTLVIQFRTRGSNLSDG